MGKSGSLAVGRGDLGRNITALTDELDQLRTAELGGDSLAVRQEAANEAPSHVTTGSSLIYDVVGQDPFGVALVFRRATILQSGASMVALALAPAIQCGECDTTFTTWHERMRHRKSDHKILEEYNPLPDC